MNVGPVAHIRIPQCRVLVVDKPRGGKLSPDQCHFWWVGGDGGSKDLERIYMAHECDLECPEEGNVLPCGAPKLVTATPKSDQSTPLRWTFLSAVMPIRDLPRGGSSRSKWGTSRTVRAASSEKDLPGVWFAMDTSGAAHSIPKADSEELYGRVKQLGHSPSAKHPTRYAVQTDQSRQILLIFDTVYARLVLRSTM